MQVCVSQSNAVCAAQLTLRTLQTADITIGARN